VAVSHKERKCHWHVWLQLYKRHRLSPGRDLIPSFLKEGVQDSLNLLMLMMASTMNCVHCQFLRKLSVSLLFLQQGFEVGGSEQRGPQVWVSTGSEKQSWTNEVHQKQS
jgi:hypothetical protein